MRKLMMLALAFGIGAWYAGRLSRRASARRLSERAATERWEAEGGAAV
jgi:hypothetical protein